MIGSRRPVCQLAPPWIDKQGGRADSGRVRTIVVVISDLHLGGDEGFEMCSSVGRRRLAELVRWAGERRSPSQEVQLVINGDVVDFLAERGPDGTFAAFTADEDQAARKLAGVFTRTEEIWEALARFAASNELTILLGNHDVELSLPAVRRRLRDRLGRVELIDDNRAFTRGPLLIEHGNRYDVWNAVPHDSLRHLRSRLSRRMPPTEYNPPPGSELVVRVMNELKASYAFVDLLKPETGAVLPILAALGATTWRSARRAIYQAARRAWRGRQFGPLQEPRDDDLIAASTGEPPGDPADAAAFRLADEIAATAGDSDLISSATDPPPPPGLLLRALRAFTAKDSSFDIGHEDRIYLDPARARIEAGFQAVVFGHTHLAKDLPLGSGRYLNSGTWADLMVLPREVLSGPIAAAEPALVAFLDDVRANRLDRVRRPVPTFVEVQLGPGDQLLGCATQFFDEGGTVAPLTGDGLLARLQR